jgi:signal transduction histidine kinase
MRPDTGEPDVLGGTAPAAATAPQGLAGLSSAIVAAAARLVWRRWRDEAAAQGQANPVDEEVAAALLSALALAVDQRRPGYITQLVPRPAPGLSHRLVEMLQTELLHVWNSCGRATRPSSILGTLTALEEVRQAIREDASHLMGAPFDSPHSLELLVEVIHDLRSPLTSILFLAESLQRGQSGDVNELQRRQLGLIYSAALGLSSVVADAIELARGSDELADGAPAPFSTTELLESVRAIAHPMAEEKGLAIRVVPPAADHRLGHPVALSRVLLNLTTNALKFTEHGYVEIGVRETTATGVTIAVRDTGPGVNAEALATLFLPFRRARGRAGYCFSGTGLGLAMTRRLVEAMGSTLRLETRPEWGTRFYFDLELPPLCPAGPALPDLHRASPERRASDARVSPDAERARA